LVAWLVAKNTRDSRCHLFEGFVPAFVKGTGEHHETFQPGLLTPRIWTLVLVSRLRYSACCWSTDVMPYNSVFIWNLCCITYYKRCSLRHGI